MEMSSNLGKEIRKAEKEPKTEETTLRSFKELQSDGTGICSVNMELRMETRGQWPDDARRKILTDLAHEWRKFYMKAAWALELAPGTDVSEDETTEPGDLEPYS